jgi:hypothetical protein
MQVKRSKQAILVNQESITAGGTATGYVDTLGYDYLTVDVITSTSDAATNNPSVLKLGQSDATSGFTDIQGTIGDTDWTIPDAVTSGTWGLRFNVDLRGRKRYVNISLSPLTTQTVTAIGTLSRADESPTDAAGAGVDALIEV